MPLSLSDPVFYSFAVASTALGTKLLFNSAWTVFNRVQRQVFTTPEDITAFGGTSPNNNDPVVERIRRMHLNDLENYTPFFILGLIYTSTGPDLMEARIAFGSFCAFRLFHTLCYLGLKSQPWRFYACAAGGLVNAFMAGRAIMALL